MTELMRERHTPHPDVSIRAINIDDNAAFATVRDSGTGETSSHFGLHQWNAERVGNQCSHALDRCFWVKLEKLACLGRKTVTTQVGRIVIIIVRHEPVAPVAGVETELRCERTLPSNHPSSFGKSSDGG